MKLCSLSGCENKHRARGYCRKHYYRLVAHGNPTGGKTEGGKPIRFIEDMAVVHEGADCLIWPYARNNNGYGKLQAYGKDVLAHRYVCEISHGAPPTPKHEAAHSCGNGHLGCVNPKHLSWKTRAENKADELDHGTRARGERVGSSKLTESQVQEILSLKGTASQSHIGSMFGVTQGRIADIFNGKTWSWLSRQKSTELCAGATVFFLLGVEIGVFF